jgi:hypothetical protein
MGVTAQDVRKSFISNMGEADSSIVSLESILGQLVDLQKRVAALEEIAYTQEM